MFSLFPWLSVLYMFILHFMYCFCSLHVFDKKNRLQRKHFCTWSLFYQAVILLFNLKLFQPQINKEKNWKLVQKMLEPRRQDFFFLFSRLNSSEGLRHGCSRVDPGAHSEFCHWTTESLHHYFRRLLLLVVLYWTDVALLSMVQFLEVILRQQQILLSECHFLQ